MLKIEDATFSWNNPESEDVKAHGPQAVENDNQSTTLHESGDKSIAHDFKDKDLLLQRITMQVHPVRL